MGTLCREETAMMKPKPLGPLSVAACWLYLLASVVVAGAFVVACVRVLWRLAR
jgi:hypothetical protein